MPKTEVPIIILLRFWKPGFVGAQKMEQHLLLFIHVTNVSTPHWARLLLWLIPFDETAFLHPHLFPPQNLTARLTLGCRENSAPAVPAPVED